MGDSERSVTGRVERCRPYCVSLSVGQWTPGYFSSILVTFNAEVKYALARVAHEAGVLSRIQESSILYRSSCVLPFYTVEPKTKISPHYKRRRTKVTTKPVCCIDSLALIH